MLRDLNVKMPSGGHGLTGVLEDTQEDLLQLGLIATHRRDDVRVVLGDVNTGDLQVGTDDYQGALQHFRNAAEATIELERFGKVENLIQDRFDSNHIPHGVFDARLRIEIEDAFTRYFFEL
jgi:hypothetical protein